MTDRIGPHPSLSDVIRHAVELGLEQVHVAVPARVERVDLDGCRIDAKPLVKDFRRDEEDVRRAVTVPVVTNVPVIFPGAGGFRVTFPVKKGDTVLLVFSERSIDSWLVSGGEVDSGDERRHDLSDAVAIPGLRDFAHVCEDVASDAVTIGIDGGEFQGAGLGAALRTELDAIWDAMYGAAGHVHAGVQTGAGTSSPATGTPSKQTVESSTVKISD